MEIIVPKDYMTINLKKETDPNRFGEALREYCFAGNCQDTGCYTTFKVLRSFKNKSKDKTLIQEVSPHLWKDIEPIIYHKKITRKDITFYCEDREGNRSEAVFGEPYEIVIAWTWDGDGALYFRFNDRAVVNHDCKCDYTWEWINENK